MSDYMSDKWFDEQNLRDTAPHASHYRNLKPEPITVIESWKLNFNLGNVIKYVSRADYKGTKKQDLEKAMWYLQREIYNEEQTKESNSKGIINQR